MKARWRVRRQQLGLVIAAGLLLVNSGCLVVAASAGAAAGGTGYAYYKGKICRDYPANFGDVWAAAQTALRDLDMPVDSLDRNSSEGTIYSRTASGDRVRVYVDAQPGRIPPENTLTRVGIRVATFGDESFSQRLLDQVGYHLVPAARLGPPAAANPGPPAPVVPASAVIPAQTAPPPLLPAEPQPVHPPAPAKPG